MLTLLYPEISFEPRTVRAVAMDLSLQGIRLTSSQLTEADWKILCSGSHHAELAIELPYLKDPLKARAIVRWSQYHELSAKGCANVEMGLEFSSLPENETARLLFAIERLRAETTSTASYSRSGIHPKKLR